MSKRPLDEVIDELSERVARLPHRVIALFSAACSERFVGLYEAFSLKDQWGEFSAVRAALDSAWALLRGEPVVPEDLGDALKRIELLTPHADDFDSLESTLAQDACICVDSTIRWCLDRADEVPHVVTYSLEAIRVAVCEAETGYLDLGSGPRAEQFEAKLITHPRILRELSLQRADLEDLTTQPIDSALVERLRQRAEQNRWSVEALASAPQ